MTTENEKSDETVDESTLDEAVSGGSGDASQSSLEERLRTALAERDAHYDRFLRSQADLENYRRRVQKERSDDARYSAAPLARDLLPAVDNLDRALEAATGATSAEDLVEGVRLVAKQLHGVLEGHAIQPIPTENEPFDPNLHEALTQIPSPVHPPMTIVQEVERGYTLHDRVLRPAKVVVSSGPPPEEASGGH
jgi:molecular chaperone GrpE